MTKDDIYNLMKAHAEKENGRFTFKVIDLKCACAELSDIIKQNDIKPGIVRGGAIEAQSVQGDILFIKDMEVKVTPNTPTEPLPAEGSAKSVCGGCGNYNIQCSCYQNSKDDFLNQLK